MASQKPILPERVAVRIKESNEDIMAISDKEEDKEEEEEDDDDDDDDDEI